MPEPRLVAALGDCALGCDVLGHADELAGRVEDVFRSTSDPRLPTDAAQIAEALIKLLDGRR